MARCRLGLSPAALSQQVSARAAAPAAWMRRASREPLVTDPPSRSSAPGTHVRTRPSPLRTLVADRARPDKAIGLAVAAALLLTPLAPVAASAATEPLPTIVDVAAGATKGSNVAGNTLDGRLDTRWSARGRDAHITYTISTAVAVNELQIAFYKGADRRTRFDVRTSSDGRSWRTVLSNARSSGSTTQLERFDVADSQRSTSRSSARATATTRRHPSPKSGLS